MIEEKVTITDSEGLHARPASDFVKSAMSFKSNVNITVGDKTINGKSVIAIMSLGIKVNTEITVSCEGEDQEEALKALVKILKDN